MNKMAQLRVLNCVIVVNLQYALCDTLRTHRPRALEVFNSQELTDQHQ